MTDQSQEEGLGLVIGESPISRVLFGTAKHRRMVKSLMGVLPIFELNGRPAARRADLSADIAERARRAMAPQEPTPPSAKRVDRR